MKKVLVGGCFDVLHPGHVIFLERAKKQGDFLVVLLEPDEKVKKLKGIKRPVHNQRERAKVLLALKSVEKVIMLPNFQTEKQYDKLVKRVKPDVIAATKGTDVRHLQRSARFVGAKFKYVTNMVGDYSTSKILNNR